MPLTKEELLAIEAKAHEHRRTIIERRSVRVADTSAARSA